MNRLEEKVKWELVVGLLVVILIMATFMLCSEREEALSSAVETHSMK